MIAAEQILGSLQVCFLKNDKEYTVREPAEGMNIVPRVHCLEENSIEYSAVITNETEEAVFLKKVTLFEADGPEALGIGPAPYDFFRSGRHKNDLPGVFTIGCNDARLRDVLSGMSESGEHEQGDQNTCVVSDHLSIIHSRENSHFFIEFLTGRDQLFETVLTLDDAANCSKISARTLFNIRLNPGESVTTETIRLAETKEVQAEIDYFAGYKTKLYGSRAGQHPSVFCTWYYYGLTVTYEDVRVNLAKMKELKLPFDVFQVDEGWEIVLGEWAPNQKFPVPMKTVAEEIRAAGYRPGIWTSPFVAHETASIWKTHPEWILRDRTGAPCLFPMNDLVYYVFDITNPATYEYFTQLYHKLTFDWGYTYHKLDFTRAAVIYEDAVFYDERVTLAKAYYRAVSAIRRGMGEEAFFVMCGGLYDPVIGLVDSQRTGSDVLSMWSSTINKDGKTAPYTIRQSILRYYMNAWWDNDPDALMIRKNEKMERGLRLTYGLLNEDEVKSSVVNQFMGGGILCSTEPLDKISTDRLYELKRLFPVCKQIAVAPVDLFDGQRFPGAVTVRLTNPATKRKVCCVCRINWSDDQPLALKINLKALGLQAEPDARFTVSDYYTGEWFRDIAATETVQLQPLAPHAAAVIKIEEQTDQPMVVASDGHYSMGCELRRLEIVEDRLYFEFEPLLFTPLHYTIQLPDGYTVDGSPVLKQTISRQAGEEKESCLKVFQLKRR